MNCAGIHGGESYRLQSTAGDVRLEVTGPRGVDLARAMKAREAQGCYYLTPGRAARWRQLFRLGFSARRYRVLNQFVWSFVSPEGERMTLADALKRDEVNA